MTENQEKIERLQTRLDRLVKTQIDFQKNVSYIREELDRLRLAGNQPADIPIRTETPVESEQKPMADPEHKPSDNASPAFASGWETQTPPTTKLPPPPVAAGSFDTGGKSNAGFSARMDSSADSARSDVEKFIGENLLSKVGIVILILGIAIGAKYAIDQGWISPVVRIVFGYVCGFALVVCDCSKETSFV